ncbi:hypothetical protein M9Y10_007689 [Tritrichomonas musculus]|uniref:Protein kinase domain-containing protein n=1 Tax=Tritrichomonas musculus TaxID=1915356 RepID=A0ABR2J390_9EUKA
MNSRYTKAYNPRNKMHDPNDSYLINLNNYKICRKLKSGGFGTVYLIQNKYNNKYFAAKVNRFQGSEKYSLLNRREISILIQIQHPTIVEFVGYSNKDFNGLDQTTIIMKFMSKGSLSDLIEKEIRGLCPSDYDNTKRQIILIGIARGMMILHSKNVIHRDLKSANVLLDDNYNPCITDFGLSKFFDPNHSMEQSEFQIGTITYMAPEVLKGLNYNEKADVYSFGILMYEVLNSTKAYKIEIDRNITAIVLANKIKKGYRPKFTVNVNEALKSLVMSCWSMDINERPTFSEIFQKLSLLRNGNFVPFNSRKLVYLEKKRAMEYCLNDVDFDEIFEYIQKVSIEKSVIKKPLIVKPQPTIASNKKVETRSTVMPPSSPRSSNVSPRLVYLKENRQKIEVYDNLYNHIEEPIYLQLSFLSEIIERNPNVNPFVIKLKKFLEFLSDSDEYSFFKYELNRNENEIIDEPQIYIKFNLTEKLVSNSYFIKQEFIDVLKEFNKVYIEIDFKSNFFGSYIGTIINIQKAYICKIAVSAIFDDFLHIKTILKQYKIIEVVKLNISNPNINCLENFFECSSLKFFFVNNRHNCPLNSIKNNAFKNCLSLQEFAIPPLIKSIGRNAFQGCISCRKIYSSFGYYQIKKNAFQGCFTLRTIILNDIGSLGLNACEGCTSLKCVNINSIEKLCSNAFKGCYSLEEITIKNIGIIDSNAFEGCTSLKIIKVDHIKRINSSAFKGCQSLEEITTESIDIIDSNAFEGCTSLKIIKVDHIKRINSSAFKGSQSLEEITTKNIDIIDSNAFEGCTSLKIINADFIDRINSNAFDGCSSLKEINSKIKEIGSRSFRNCSSLEKIMIDDIKSNHFDIIEEGAFEGCSSLIEISFGCYFSEREMPFKIYEKNSIKKIKKSAFERCSSLNSIANNLEVDIIEESAFENCSKLENFDLSNTKEIKSRCFAYCSSLTQIIIPISISHIPAFAFYGCLSLEKLTFLGQVKIIDDYAFGLCKSLTQVLFPSSLQKIGIKAFSSCTSLLSIAIPKSVKSIGLDAFYKCTNLKGISLPSSFNVKSIGLYDTVTISKI